MRFYPWDAQGADNMVKAPESQLCVLDTQQIPSQNVESLTRGKRKRSFGQDGNTSTKRSPVNLSATFVPGAIQQTNAAHHTKTLSPLPCFPSTSIIDNGPTPPMSPAASPVKKETDEAAVVVDGSLSAMRLESLKRNLQTQIGLEILLKHNELRLIDQELAKCQVAYEQLRRCTEIPYPATQRSLDLSHYEGRSTQNASGGPSSHSLANWSVVDGPYARHYAKWLLPDPAFTGVDARSAAGQHSEFARSTRGKPIETVITTATRGNKSKALLLPSLPKDKSGPMIIKRKSDGQWVKLRCLDCARDDFGSAQGFINHCRIQHHRNFTSHDAAAAACGEVVDGGPASAGQGAPLAHLSATLRSGAVHPLIRSAHLIKPNLELVESTQETSIEQQAQQEDGHEIPRMSTDVSALSSPAKFQASPYTPNLSALIRNRGLGINVQDLVEDAKSRAPLPDAEEDASDMDMDTPAVEPFRGQHPQVAGSKQLAKPMQPGKGSKTSSFGHLRGGGRVPAMHTGLLTHGTSDLELEPSPTNEFNQAPSLVDDDEDDEYEARSTSSSSEAGETSSEVNFHIEDEDVAPPSNLSPLYADSGKQQMGSLQRRPSAFRRGFNNSREEKHVSFVSPSPAREMSGHDSKKRKR